MSCWRSNRDAILTHGFNVQRNGFTNELKGFHFCITSGNTTVQIGNVCRLAVAGLFEHYRVFSHGFNPACLNIERTVPVARSLLRDGSRR